MTSGCLLAFVRGLTRHFARFEPAGEVSPKFEYRSFAQSRNHIGLPRNLGGLPRNLGGLPRESGQAFTM
jgi:hypothetical protein